MPSVRRWSPQSKFLWSIALAVLSLGVGVGGMIGLASLKQPPGSRPQVEKTYNVVVFETKRSDLQEVISGFGTARADRETVISAQVDGEVVELHPRLRVGQTMRAADDVTLSATGESVRSAGDVLVRIDPQTYEELLAEAQNRLGEDDAELTQLKQEEANNLRLLAQVKQDVATFAKEYERIKKLSTTDAASKSLETRTLLELRQYEERMIERENLQQLFPLRFKLVEQRKQTHQTQLGLAKLDLGRTEVRPPFSGVLSEVLVDEGQYVRAGDALVQLTDLARIEVPVPITLADYAKIEPAVRAGKFPLVELAENETAESRWSGSIVRVAPAADELTRTVQVFVEVDNRLQKSPLLPGAFVHARIDGPVLKNALAVPRDAIVGGKLFVTAGEQAESRPTVVRRTLQSLAIIESGLKPGERVVLTNLDVLHDGARLKIQDQRSLTDELQQQRTQVAREPRTGGLNGRGG